ncbi:MAG TPA: tRNA (guanine(10)-N(2))-dimethyltransferase, partial [Methanotrichaceae archaeon]|nr:tRNA (guanine(10)-N(2))-dimethyltransferase [Methanotrichaceae archaeon]
MADLIEEGAVTFDAEGVFYNPRMKLNRDIGVAMAKSLGISEYLDGLASSGARGLRVAKEAGVARVILNDVNPLACERISQNLERNDLTRCEVSCSNANVLMHQRHFQTVDLDPFGSPSPFISAAARSALEYLFITATDTAPLCGAHLQSGIRKYMAVPVKTDYHREMGARILLGQAARELARLDKAMVPMLTHVTQHYVRTYLRVEQGAKPADDSLKKMGYIQHCHGCGSFSAVLVPITQACEACGGRTVIAGPLWLGPIQDREVISRAIPEVGQNAPARKLLEACRGEVDVPMYYDHHRLCKKLGGTPGKVDSVVESLRELGFNASRTHFTGIGIKTDASLE